MEDDPRGEEKSREEDVIPEPGVHVGEGGEERGEFHERCDSENVFLVRSEADDHHDGVDGVVDVSCCSEVGHVLIDERERRKEGKER